MRNEEVVSESIGRARQARRAYEAALALSFMLSTISSVAWAQNVPDLTCDITDDAPGGDVDGQIYTDNPGEYFTTGLYATFGNPPSVVKGLTVFSSKDISSSGPTNYGVKHAIVAVHGSLSPMSQVDDERSIVEISATGAPRTYRVAWRAGGINQGDRIVMSGGSTHVVQSSTHVDIDGDNKENEGDRYEVETDTALVYPASHFAVYRGHCHDLYGIAYYNTFMRIRSAILNGGNEAALDTDNPVADPSYVIVAPHFQQQLARKNRIPVEGGWCGAGWGEGDQQGCMIFQTQWRIGRPAYTAKTDGIYIDQPDLKSNPEYSPFDALNDIGQLLHARFPNLETILFIGHSAGAIAMARYPMHSEIEEIFSDRDVHVRYVVESPAHYTYLHNRRIYEDDNDLYVFDAFGTRRHRCVDEHRWQRLLPADDYYVGDEDPGGWQCLYDDTEPLYLSCNHGLESLSYSERDDYRTRFLTRDVVLYVGAFEAEVYNSGRYNAEGDGTFWRMYTFYRSIQDVGKTGSATTPIDQWTNFAAETGTNLSNADLLTLFQNNRTSFQYAPGTGHNGHDLGIHAVGQDIIFDAVGYHTSNIYNSTTWDHWAQAVITDSLIDGANSNIQVVNQGQSVRLTHSQSGQSRVTRQNGRVRIATANAPSEEPNRNDMVANEQCCTSTEGVPGSGACSDGFDNDCDGAFDGADIDCI